jgi:hypothetical protein
LGQPTDSFQAYAVSVEKKMNSRSEWRFNRPVTVCSPTSVRPDDGTSTPKCGEDKRMELVALLILIALIALVGGIVEESAETH